MELRDYQQEAYDETLKKFEQTDTALCVMATGLGKTIYFSHIVDHFRKTGRIMVIAHREELIFQAQDKIQRITDTEADIEMGADWAGSGWTKSEIVVSTVQTQVAGRLGGRMTRFPYDEFSLLVVDEAAHAPAATYRKVIDYYKQNKNLKVLGVTAVPDRHDGLAMGQIFSEVAYEYGIRDGIDDGWLVAIEQQSVFVSSLDYSNVKSQAGDLNGKDLAKVLEFEENLHAIASPTIELTGDKKTLIFAASVVQAERLTEIINRHKPGSARFVHGKTPKEIRRGVVSDYAVNKFQYLLNVGVFVEGFDDDSIQCVVLARPTKSRSLYTQQVGRGTRVLESVNVDQYDDAVERREAIAKSGKKTLTVLDFVGNAGRHKLMTAADILGGKYDDDVVELAARNAEKESAATGKPVDVATELQAAEREIAKRQADREEAAWRDKVKLRAFFSTAKVNPFDILDVNPVREVAWHKGKPPTKKQLEYLKGKGVDTDGMGFTHAKQVIDTLWKRQQDGKATFKQTKVLIKYKYDTTNMTFGEAGKLIGQLARNGWRRPYGKKGA